MIAASGMARIAFSKIALCRWSLAVYSPMPTRPLMAVESTMSLNSSAASLDFNVDDSKPTKSDGDWED